MYMKQQTETADAILVKGARVNNLKNIDVRIPRDKFVVITGVSGSGKSSLAFDTLYAEGQRRYVESLSAYARQFLGRMNKPECDYIKGLPPAIAIEQKVTGRNPRSTVGTSTEIYDYLRMLFARVGHTFSPVSGQEVRRHSPGDVVAAAMAFSRGTRFTLLAPFKLKNGRSLREQLDVYQQQGLSRVDIGGEIVRMEDVPDDAAPDSLYLLIDRLVADDSRDFAARLADSVETALYEGGGTCLLRIYPTKLLQTFSTRFEADGIVFEEPSDRMFSFNSPAGACPECEGFGQVIGIDEQLVVPDPSLSLYDDAVVCWRGEKMSEWKKEFIRRNADSGFPIFEPYHKLTQKQKDWLWHGSVAEQNLPEDEQVSIDAFFRMLRQNQYKIQYRVMLARYRGKTLCPACRGSRLKPAADYVHIGGKSIGQLTIMPVTALLDFFETLELPAHEVKTAERLLTEIKSRLRFLCDVGLGYLTLDRRSNTLSGGESQRINLSTSLGSSLVGSLYILDEPSIGLHPRDTARLIGVLQKLRDLGNTVVVVEHDEEIIRAADYIIDIGPDAGSHGGCVVWQGTAAEALAARPSAEAASHTLEWLQGTDAIALPPSRRAWNKSITVEGACANNLRGISVAFPLNVLTVVTGVSGSGKSTLVRDILYRALKRSLDEACERPGLYSRLTGDLEDIKAVEFVDQNPIGKSSRSNPVTYVKAYDEIRKLMASQPLARQMDLTPAHFSFNTDGGRCEACKGEGQVKVEMQFMADLVLPCEECGGKRFKKDVLEVKFEDKNIYDLLEMTVDQAIDFFTAHGQAKIAARLRPLQEVGLGYIKLGQPGSTLSGGESQRVKLAYHLGQEHSLPTMFIFDEPTTGLHHHDTRRLINVFGALIDRGHTIVVIEHNLDVIKSADYVIDLGPEGGRGGGDAVALGTPEEVAASGKGYTSKFLRAAL